jgi:hypothetical protein
MRRWIILILAAACAVAGCGSNSSSSSPVTTELSYLPQSSPLVLTVATDPNSNAIRGVQALVNRFPLAGLGIAALKQKLQQGGVNYDGDVRPLLGNPVAVAIPAQSFSSPFSTGFLVVWVSKDGAKLKSLLKKSVPGLHQAGTHDGATIYETGATGVLALDGSTAVIGNSLATVNSALDRHAHGGGITQDQYSKASASLPQDAVVKSFGDLSSIFSSPRLAAARRVPWVAAIRGYSEAITASSSGLTISYHVDTTGRPLTSSQLPFAEGTSAPAIDTTAPISVGIHNPAQIATFIESAAQATSPASYGRFLQRQSALRAKTGTDLNSLIKLLTGDLTLSSDTHTTIARVDVSDPAAAKRTLDKLAGSPYKGNPLKKAGSGYVFQEGAGARIVVDLIGNKLVIGKATPAQMRAYAAGAGTPAPGAHGTVAFRVSLTQLLTLALRGRTPPQIVQSFLSQLSDFTGSASVTATGLTGSATIGVK